MAEMEKVKFPVKQYADDCPAIKVDIKNGTTIFVTEPVKVVKVNDNKVEAYYDGWKETITAEGSGNERYNFKRTVEEVSS